MAAIVLPSAQTTHFESNVNQGVIGGVRANGTAVYVADYGALEEGPSGSVSANTDAFGLALAASTPGQDVVWPAGIYRVFSLSIGFGVNNRKIRGAVDYGTELRPTGSSGITGGVDMGFADATATVAAGFTKGTTSFTVTDVVGSFTVGRLMSIIFPLEATTPIVSPYGYNTIRNATVRCTGWNAGTSTLSFFPALDFDIVNTTGVTVGGGNYNTPYLLTIQDLHINGVSGAMAYGLVFSASDQFACVRVKVTNFTNRGIWFNKSLCPEIFCCYTELVSSGSNKAGIQFDSVSHGLVQYSCAIGTFPNIEINGSSAGCIFGYNYFPEYTNVNHGAHNSLNLYEGNITAFFWDDGYFGGSCYQIFFRNWCRNKNNGVFKRCCRKPTMIGNITGIPGETYTGLGYDEWGDPNLSNDFSTGTAQPSTSDFWQDWDASNGRVKRWTGTVTSGEGTTSGVVTLDGGQASDFEASRAVATDSARGLGWGANGNLSMIVFITASAPSGDVVTVSGASGNLPTNGTVVTFWPCPKGFQEKDLDVLALADVRANYHVYGAAIPAGQELAGGETLPDSLYLSSKPAIFGDLPWPPFDPFAPGTPSIEDNPAGFYYVNGFWPNTTPSAPTITLQPVTQTVTEGDDVTLSANATGSPAPTWQWKKGGADISGATTRFLVLLDVEEADEGSYTAVATNTEGTDTSAAGVLTVNSAGPEDGGRPYAPTNLLLIP